MFSKVKNHATVQRAQDLSTGTRDNVHAGTQVLLNTLPLVLLPHHTPFHYPPTTPPSSLSQFSPGRVQVQKPICCTSPRTCLSARTFHHVTLKKKKSKTWEGTQILSSTRHIAPEHKMPPKSRRHTSFPLFYELAAAFVWLTRVSPHKGQSSLTRGRRIRFISAYYGALIVCDNNVKLTGEMERPLHSFTP